MMCEASATNLAPHLLVFVTPGVIESAVAAFAQSPNRCPTVLVSPLATLYRELIIALAARFKLPAGATWFSIAPMSSISISAWQRRSQSVLPPKNSVKHLGLHRAGGDPVAIRAVG